VWLQPNIKPCCKKLHTAYVDILKQMIEAMKSKNMLPINTFCSGDFVKIFGNRVIMNTLNVLSLKKIELMFFFSLIFFSCKKDYLIPENEIPEWLKIRISQDEQIIKQSPNSGVAYGAWLRYKWQNEYYFEYHNILSVSSSFPIPFSVNGDSLIVISGGTNSEYWTKKCCEQYVWKAPKY